MQKKFVGEEVRDEFLDFNFLEKVKINLAEGIIKQYEKYEADSNKENLTNKEKLDLKIKQLSTAKILVNIHKRNPEKLIHSHLQLAEVYKQLNYIKQAHEHNRQALKKYYINFELDRNFPLLFEIYAKLIQSCYELKSYNQTINYINYYNEILEENKKEILTEVVTIQIDMIKGKTEYALNDFEKAEKQFEQILEQIDQNPERLKLVCPTHMDFNTFVFSLKSEIHDFIFKIKGKEDKPQEQH